MFLRMQGQRTYSRKRRRHSGHIEIRAERFRSHAVILADGDNLQTSADWQRADIKDECPCRDLAPVHKPMIDIYWVIQNRHLDIARDAAQERRLATHAAILAVKV